jgi:hypothetical protein
MNRFDASADGRICFDVPRAGNDLEALATLMLIDDDLSIAALSTNPGERARHDRDHHLSPE